MSEFIKKVFYFILYCVRYFLTVLFVLFLFSVLPLIVVYWLFFGNDLFDYLNEVAEKIVNIMENKLEVNKEKFAAKKINRNR